MLLLSSRRTRRRGPKELQADQPQLHPLEIISRYTNDKNVTRISQHGFTKGKSCLPNLYDEMTGLVDERSG